MASRLSINRLKKVDFPTLGLPTMATILDMRSAKSAAKVVKGLVASRKSGRRLFEVSEATQFVFLFSPVVGNFYVRFQKDFLSEELFHIGPRLGSYFL